MGLMNRKRQLGGNFLAWTDGTHRRSGCKRGSLREKDALIGALIMKKNGSATSNRNSVICLESSFSTPDRHNKPP